MVLENRMDVVVTLGITSSKPNMHWAFDIAECMASDGFLLDAFVLERLHLRVKHIADKCCSLTQYHAAVMAGVTHHHVNTMMEKTWASPCSLVGNVAIAPWVSNTFMSAKAKCFGEHFAVGSYVCRGSVSWLGG